MKSALPQILQPAHWPRPKGFSHGMAASGRVVFVAGQVGWDSAGRFVSDRLADQVRVALENVVTVLAEAGARPEHVTRLVWYVTSRAEYYADLKEIGANYRAVMGRNFPAMSVVQVVALMESEAKVEIEATGVVPEAD
jgi:enamine deaminase RidA (YjgF/YER057c/UK114 family)